MRQLVSYDDIVSHQEQLQNQPTDNDSVRPTKKWRKNKKTSKAKAPSRHWDEPSIAEDAEHYEDGYVCETDDVPETSQDAQESGPERYDGGSRELTYDDIWDDSALINAWNAATEEYEAHHGPGKKWKTEPVNKSPLWYNVPPPRSNENTQAETGSLMPSYDGDDGDDMETELENNCRPQDFAAFIPTHDSSLRFAPSIAGPAHTARGGPYPIVGQDEAFNCALGAMYWTGYWTAMYYCSKSRDPGTSGEVCEGEQVSETGEGEAQLNDLEGVEEFVSTQR